MAQRDTDWNPRYVLYARAHGRDAAAQLDQDRKDWPGGVGVGFQRWNNEHIATFLETHPEHDYWGALSETGQEAYTLWLEETYPA